MSGIATIATIAAVASAAVGAGSMIYGIKQGGEQQDQQKKALAQQKTAQQTAEANALSTQRKGEVAQNAANMKTPDIAAILSRAAGAGRAGLGSTMLTGPGGVSPSTLPLGGGSSLLGG